MSRALGFAAALALWVAPATAQTPTGRTPGGLVTDRPGQGLRPHTVAPWDLQLEGGVHWAMDESDGRTRHALGLPIMFRLGVPEIWEVRLGTGGVGVEIDGGRAQARATDTSLGGKVRLLEAVGPRPALGASLDVIVPSGEGAFTADAVVPELRILAAWPLPRGWRLLLNGGVDVPEDEAGRYGRLVHLAQLSWSPPVRGRGWWLFVETFGREALSGPRADLLQLGVGTALRVGRDWQLDLASRHGLNRAAPDLVLSLGVSARL